VSLRATLGAGHELVGVCSAGIDGFELLTGGHYCGPLACGGERTDVVLQVPGMTPAGRDLQPPAQIRIVRVERPDVFQQHHGVGPPALGGRTVGLRIPGHDLLMAAGLSQPVGRSLVIGLLAEHSLKQLDRLIPTLREECGQTGGVVRLDRSWICLGRLVLVTSGGTAGVPTRFSIAAIRRPTSEENDSCRSVIPCRLANGASTSGSSVRTGIRAPSTSTGMTGTLRCNAVAVSATTQSLGSSSLRRPFSSSAVVHWVPMIDKKTSQSFTARLITSVKSVPGSMVSMSMNTWNLSTRRSANRPAT
jgi:hypothetical protein